MFMTMTRREALGLIAALPLTAAQLRSPHARPLRVGSKSFDENMIIAEIYTEALRRGGFLAELHVNLGSTEAISKKLASNAIDLYPDYLGTGYIAALPRDFESMSSRRSSKDIFTLVRAAYEQRFKSTWLCCSAASNSQGLAITKDVSRKYGLETISECVKLAKHLRLAAIPEFMSGHRLDGISRLKSIYGDFDFANPDVPVSSIGDQYRSILYGTADVAAVFTTDAQIKIYELVLLKDNKRAWPPYNVAPVIALSALNAHSGIEQVLNSVSGILTTELLVDLNDAVSIKKANPPDVARDFLDEAQRSSRHWARSPCCS